VSDNLLAFEILRGVRAFVGSRTPRLFSAKYEAMSTRSIHEASKRVRNHLY